MSATDARPFSEFRERGLLWLVNRCVFHPRGYALAFNVEDDGTVSGWGLLGDGTEPWQYDPTATDPDGWTEDAAFAAAEAFLASLRPAADGDLQRPNRSHPGQTGLGE